MRVNDWLTALVVVFAWGLSFIVVKWGLHDMPPFLFATLRFACVAVFAAALPRPSVPLKDLLSYGIFWGTIQFGSLFLAVHLGMPAGITSVVVQSQAFFSLIFSIVLLGESWRIHQAAGLVFAGLGLGFIVSDRSGSVTIAGFSLILCGAMGWAYGNILVRKMSHHIGNTASIAFLAWASIVPTLTLAAMSLMLDGPARISASLFALNSHSITAIFYQAFISLLLGSLLWNRLLKRYPINTVAPFSLLVPVIGLMAAVLVMHETFSVWQWLGCALLIGGLVVNIGGGRLNFLRRGEL